MSIHIFLYIYIHIYIYIHLYIHLFVILILYSILYHSIFLYYLLPLYRIAMVYKTKDRRTPEMDQTFVLPKVPATSSKSVRLDMHSTNGSASLPLAMMKILGIDNIQMKQKKNKNIYMNT